MKSVLFEGLLLAGSVSVAQTDVVQEPDRVVVRPVTHEDFDVSKVVGELTRPTSEYVPVRKAAKFDCLIQVRANFNPELSRSVDAL